MIMSWTEPIGRQRDQQQGYDDRTDKAEHDDARAHARVGRDCEHDRDADRRPRSTKWVQAPREKLNSSPPTRIISTATSRSLMPRTNWLTRSQTIGKIRNGP